LLDARPLLNGYARFRRLSFDRCRLAASGEELATSRFDRGPSLLA
jgi:hypothetical protein